MKKFLAALLCAALFLSPALCEGDFPDFLLPAETEAPMESAEPLETEAPAEPIVTPEPLVAGGWMTAELYGQTLPMLFDVDPAYSYVEDDLVQAAFYRETNAGTVYEIDLTFPLDVRAGDSVSTESAILAGDELSGVILYTLTDNASTYAWATQYMGMEYPYGAHYSIAFDSVETEGTFARFSGTLSALLMPELALMSGGEIELTARFAFTIDTSEAIYAPDEAPGRALL